MLEKCYIICVPKVGAENEGTKSLIGKALYGGKSAGWDYWLHLRSCMEFLGFTPCKADADACLDERSKKSDRATHWEYVLLYVNECLHDSIDPEIIIKNEIGMYFKVKEPSIGE